MLAVVTVCATLIVILLWIFLWAILSTLSGIHHTLNTIQEGIESSQISLANIETLADNVFEHVD